jgi:hypothetical protein
VVFHDHRAHVEFFSDFLRSQARDERFPFNRRSGLEMGRRNPRKRSVLLGIFKLI